MTPKQRFEACLAGKPVDRPPFAPAVYEHKAKLIDSSPSVVCRDPDLLTKALFEEYDRYRTDMLVVGVDVYNVEAETQGVRVKYYEAGDDSVPGIPPGGEVLALGESPEKLPMPDPWKSGRMPLFLAAAKAVQKKLGGDVMVTGALSGPYSLACELVGTETFMIATSESPDYAQALLNHAADVIFQFGKAFLSLGVEPIVFDSRASPPMTSPGIFGDIYQPATAKLMARFFEAGAKFCPLILGGDCTPVAETYANTGSRQILSDFTSDWSEFSRVCREKNIAVRRNLNPAVLEKGNVEKIELAMAEVMAMGKGMPKFIAGTGIVSCATSPDSVLAARRVAWA